MGANEVEVEDEYACVARGRLSLKADSGISKKKKKKKPQQQAAPSAPPTPPASSQPAPALRRTPAEIAFQKMQEKMVSVNI